MTNPDLEERMKIVKFLRDLAEEAKRTDKYFRYFKYLNTISMTLNAAANLIEKGDHNKSHYKIIQVFERK